MTEFIFTFGFGHTDPVSGVSRARKFVRIKAADHESARHLMNDTYGQQWAFQYESEAEAGVERHGLIELPPSDDWTYTPEQVVGCWKGSFSGDDQALRDEMLEEIAATIDYCFNCADHDEDIYSILTSAVRHAAAYISKQPCRCTDDNPCARCLALGRYFDKRNER